MIWGGARAKAVKKNSTATRPGKKKLNSTTPKKKKTQLPVGQEKKTQLPVGQEKKLNANSLPEGPPRSLMVRPLRLPLISI